VTRPRIVIIGGGFAGYYAARSLCSTVRDKAEVVILNPTDYFLYLPLLPEVAAGVLDPRRVTVSIPGTAPRVDLVLGSASGVDMDEHRVSYRDADGRRASLAYDRLLITTGSVNKLLPIPGVAEHARGFRSIAEALYLRDHMIRQIELADSADDPAERDARLTFVVVGAGYTGTEVAAQGVLMTTGLAGKHPRLAGRRPRWLLVDTADRVLPGLGANLATTAARVLRRRGVEVRTGASVAEAMAESIRLSDGSHIGTRSLIWCVGVRPEPLVQSMGLDIRQGRLVVDEYLSVPGQPDVWACGDVAAVPDLTRPSEITPMTAQHAQRQGKRAAGNIAATFGHGTRRPYKHHDLGFVVDLGGWQAAANPLHVPLSGLAAKTVTRGYHLLSLPGNRGRTTADWITEAILPRQAVQLGLVHAADAALNTDQPSA